NMAEAIIGGILDCNVFSKAEICAMDIDEARIKYIREKYGINAVLNSQEELKKSEIVILSVKPQSLAGLMDGMKAGLNPESLFLSILAGVKIGTLEKYINFEEKKSKIVRVMPNLGAFVRKSVSAIAFKESIKKNDRDISRKIFESIGYVHFCDESLINSVTAVSGSGPAYLFQFMDSFVESAKSVGIKENEAFDYCIETFEGALNLLMQRKDSPKDLVKKVASKGGTTEAALNVFNNRGFESLIKEAVTAAFNRAKELGEKC
ncbi:MAG: hypothetical protein ACD_79C01489G0003, partial [uncultured bacterium]